MSAMQGRVLLAVSAPTRQRLLPCLAGHEVVWAANWAEVCAAAARDHFDLVVVASDFAESSAFDIIRDVKRTDPGARVICVRGINFSGRLGASTLQAVSAACEAIDCPFVDLLEYPDNESGRRAIRARLDEVLASRASSHS